MFDLNAAVENWRRELSQGEAIAAEDIREMEMHLYEEMQGLEGKGLSMEEAFFVAVRRLGSAKDLACEFAKVNGALVWQRRLFWMLAGVMLFMVAHAVAGVAAKGFTLVSTFAGLRGERIGLAESFVSTAVLIATFYGVYRMLRLGRTQAGCPRHGVVHRIFGLWGGKAGARTASTAALLITAAVVVFVCTAATHFAPLLQFRLLGAEEIGRITLGIAYGWALWAVAAPFGLAIVLILMSRRKRGRIA